MIRLHNIKLPLDYAEKTLVRAACQKLGTTAAQVASCAVSKRSVDARKKNDVCFVVSLDVTLRNAQDERRIAARLAPSVGGIITPYAPPAAPRLPNPPTVRPVVVGFGPAGLFAALTLAEAGACPLVLERGQDAKALTGFHSSIYRGGLPAIAFCKHCFNTSGTGIVVVISDLLGFDLALQELLTAFYLLDRLLRLPLERCKRFRYKRSDGKGYIEIFPVPFL